jgi:hypothetical protein
MNEKGAVIIENNIFASLCLLSKKSPADFVGLSGNGNKIFTGTLDTTEIQRLSSPTHLFSC